jgi:hypothetical protein
MRAREGSGMSSDQYNRGGRAVPSPYLSPDGLWLWNGYQWVPVSPPPAIRRKRKVFVWVFLAVQAVFVLWLLTGVSTVADCDNAPCQAGVGIGAFIILMLWTAVDLILGIGYAVYYMATRR